MKKDKSMIYESLKNFKRLPEDCIDRNKLCICDLELITDLLNGKSCQCSIVLLWVLVGGVFFGGVHDFGALFASIRHKGQSIGEIISSTMGRTAKRLFIIFSYLTLLLVVAAFASIVLKSICLPSS